MNTNNTIDTVITKHMADNTKNKVGERLLLALKSLNNISRYFLLFLLLPCVSHAAVYKCVVSGNVIEYSSNPCVTGSSGVVSTTVNVKSSTIGTNSSSTATITGTTTVVSAASAIVPTQFVQPSDFSGKLHGFNIEFTNHPDPTFYPALRGYGANLVRVFVQFSRCATCNSYAITPANIAVLNGILKAAALNNFKVVVVGQFQQLLTGEIWTHPEFQSSIVNNWQWLAKQYVDNTAIAGFDLLNEPNPFTDSAWQPFAQRIVDAIRTVDKNHVVIMESVHGADASGFKILKPLTDSRVVYSLHFYSALPITEQLVQSAYDKVIPYPAGIEYGLGSWDSINGVGPWDKNRLSLMLNPVRQFQKTYNAIIYVGEFSCVRWAPSGSSTRWVTDAQDLFNVEQWSWTYFNFRGYSGFDAEIANDNYDSPDVTRTPDAPTISILKGVLSAFQKQIAP